MFEDLLRRYVIENVWGSPSKESLFVIKPARLSRMRGAVAKQKVAWDEIPLPTRRDTYHVFQIGKVSPLLLGIGCITNQWVSLEDIINSTYLVSEVYDQDGVIYPRHACFVRLNKSGNLILAVRKMRLFLSIDSEDIYLRMYTNAFYFSARNTYGNEATHCTTFIVSSEDVAIQANYQYSLEKQKPGFAWGYKNGVFVANFNPATADNGDILEIFYDASVYRVLDFDLNKTTSFTSDLDDKHKFLLHYPEDNNTTIDYVNNLDLYLVKKTGNVFKGYYYHKHHIDSVRMLTHKDYSVPVSYVNGLFHAHSDEWGNLAELTLMLVVRKGGFDRPLVSEANKIFELYGLDADKVKAAMNGVSAVVDNWQAQHLEKSAYPRIMTNKTGHFDITDIQMMLGYDSIVKAYADTPIRVTSTAGRPEVILPPLLSNDVTVFEYDIQGRLIDFHYHDDNDNSHYRCYSENTHYVEVIVGKGGETIDVQYNTFELTLEPTLNYRSYMCGYYNAKPTNQWIDVSNTGVTVPENGKLTINADPIYWYPAFVSDKKFLCYRLNLTPFNGIYQFTVRDKYTVDYQEQWRETTIPPRRIDVWLNGKWLVRNVDFFVTWPRVVLTCKEHLKPGDTQDVVFRSYGFCTEDIELEASRETGFVTNGYLSANNKYDSRDDKVLSFFVDGRLRMMDTLKFAESISEPQVTNARNGAPYEVKETIISLRDMSYLDTYDMRDQARLLDKKIEDYKTLNAPQDNLPLPNFITDKWLVVSPFMQRVHSALINREIPTITITGQYSDQKIHELVSDYLEYLEFDPIKQDVHTGYVEVHAHRFSEVLEVNVYHYNFLARVNKIYMDGKVNLSQQVKVIVPTEGEFS